MVPTNFPMPDSVISSDFADDPNFSLLKHPEFFSTAVASLQHGQPRWSTSSDAPLPSWHFLLHNRQAPGARISISTEVPDTPQEISLLSSRRHSDKSSTTYILVYNIITPMTQYTGGPRSWHYQASWDTTVLG